MRVVSLSPSVTEVLFAIGAQDEIVGVTEYCDTPVAAQSLPVMGGWKNSDVSRVVAQKPDIVFTSSIVQNKIHNDLKKQNVNVVHLDPKTVHEVFESFIVIGNHVNRTEEAQKLVDKCKTELNSINPSNKKVRVYCEEWPMMVSCNWVPEMIALAGGKGLGTMGQISHTVSFDDVKTFDPDCIVVSWCGFGTNVSKDKITTRDGWSGLRAVQNKKVFVVDDSLLNRPGPRLVEGVKALASIFSSVA